ncbi:hypothetical protein AGABI1DRAFT_110077 [Agaricus bisporus var. burnettii JB137-S8]|uniref:G-patch domain-containing protein n=1 Tax=Agaricus bisporus var. burnettii (strain JB137-S8 / ATCC MYA-4627 / FGSC 10392) TaxID=597362 RepID=K5X6A0_AGABU|nr:uncharacterized protein AGABI1DRAFT_110077 [Agaricus bisporus var. burnettii JB137-S8]EKM83411.1 hypothetical protein AGABI1DRAFT_110077 [Agaricus bisporus var. burnettii JB137-S8]
MDEDDDDVSPVSRSPSPDSGAMDVDPSDHISKYDEFIHKPVHETITVESKIKSTNKGFALLAKMGWSEGQPVGLSGDGRVDPIPFEIKYDSTGLGKTTQDVRMIEETVSQRRGLDSERQTRETEEQRRAREDTVARQAAVKDEVSNAIRSFYCMLCDKQFQNVAQYDEHTNSYAHHHKARFKDMQANARPKAQEEIDRRKEKERKREERELRKIAAAAGIKVPKVTPAVPAPTPAAVTPVGVSAESDGTPSEKKRGWASVGDPSAAVSTSTGFKKSGWATVGSSSTPQPSQTSDQAKSSNWAPAPSASIPPQPPMTSRHTSHTPSFRTGGWTSLDTTSDTVNPSPPPPPAAHSYPYSAPPMQPSSPPPPPPPSSSHPSLGGRGGWSSSSATHASATLRQSEGLEIPTPTPDSIMSAPTPKPLSNPPAVPVRSGWQKFQAKNNKRK